MKKRKWDLILATAFVFAGLLIASPWAWSAPLTPERARDIYYVAYGQFTGPRDWLEQMPTVHVLTKDELCAFVHYRSGCSIQGAYQPGNVYIPDALDFDNVYDASMLLHEFIHHFQFLKHGDQEMRAAFERGDREAGCGYWMADEQQAYTIQAHVLEKAGDYGGAQQIRMAFRTVTCR